MDSSASLEPSCDNEPDKLRCDPLFPQNKEYLSSTYVYLSRKNGGLLYIAISVRDDGSKKYLSKARFTASLALGHPRIPSLRSPRHGLGEKRIRRRKNTWRTHRTPRHIT